MRDRTPSGKLREKVEVFRLTGSINAYGNPYQSWTSQGTRKASIVERTGREQLDAGALQDGSVATLRMRYDSMTKTITPKDRLTFRGDDWDVQSVIQATDRRRWIEVLVERGKAT